MTVAEFKQKWSRYQGKESAAYQEHFIDLCRLLGQPTPVEADPSGNDFFCFQKRVVKGAEFLNLEHPDCGDPTERGFADVWRKDCYPPMTRLTARRTGACSAPLSRDPNTF